MHCQDWEERVALHAGGDLAAANPADAAAVERHLTECAGCQALWSGMKESLELLRAEHAEVLAPGIYTAVRGRVLARLEAGRMPWWRRGWVVGLAAAAVVVLVLVLASWPGTKVEMPPLRVLAVIPPAPAEQGLRTGQRQAGGLPYVRQAGGLPYERQARGLPHGRRLVSPEQAGKMPRQPLMVRLVTDDPNVIIYWIAE
jgi:hypothetical protein